MGTLFIILFFLIALYGFFILWITIGCFKIEWFRSTFESPKHTFSIVVPFRNENHTLPTLLSSFSKLNYPKELFEVILVDDDSFQPFLIHNTPFSIKVIQNERQSASPKKDAIRTAIRNSKFDWIITTDADCEVPENWLLVLDNYIQKQPKARMVCGMVFSKITNDFLGRFQLLDFASLQSATIGTFGIGRPLMCNGANFAYQKDFFEELNGFVGNDNIASGDDVFLLQKAIKKQPNNIFYLRSNDFTVVTHPVLGWKGMFLQRVRWASKTKAYQNSFAKVLAFVVLFGNLGFILSVLGLLWDLSFLILILFKLLVDFVLLLQSKKTNPIFYVLSGFIYPFFSFAVGVYVFINKKYIWKDRVVYN